MKRKKFPIKIDYGRDDFHGRSGPEDTNPGSGFAPGRGGEGTGYALKKFRGKHLDHLSIEELKDNDAATQEVFEFNEDQKFISRMGFGTDGTTLK
jgi:hypothetical protein